MKYILFLFMLVSNIFAISVNESLLKIHAVLIPKIYLMDYDFKEKIKHNSITIAILYEPHDYKNALLLEKEIEIKYHNKIEKYNIKTVLVNYKNINKAQANIYYLFPTTDKNIKKTITVSKEKHALTFSYLSKDLKNGVMMSLEIGSKVKPIINLGAVKSNNITFRPVLLKISHIYTNEKNALYLYSVDIKDFFA